LLVTVTKLVAPSNVSIAPSPAADDVAHATFTLSATVTNTGDESISFGSDVQIF
jgi:hypothetical protein